MTRDESKLLKYATEVNLHAQLVGTCAERLDNVSPDVARTALAHVEDAIHRLQAMAAQLGYRVSSE
jgi:hypothetical protein